MDVTADKIYVITESGVILSINLNLASINWSKRVGNINDNNGKAIKLFNNDNSLISTALYGSNPNVCILDTTGTSLSCYSDTNIS